MCDQHRRVFLHLSVLAIGAAAVAGTALAADAPAAGKKVYTCPPCGCPNDGKEFPEPGACSACGMPLVEKVATAPTEPKQSDKPSLDAPPSKPKAG
jgi:hypothetical protein